MFLMHFSSASDVLLLFLFHFFFSKNTMAYEHNKRRWRAEKSSFINDSSSARQCGRHVCSLLCIVNIYTRVEGLRRRHCGTLAPSGKTSTDMAHSYSCSLIHANSPHSSASCISQDSSRSLTLSSFLFGCLFLCRCSHPWLLHWWPVCSMPDADRLL